MYVHIFIHVYVYTYVYIYPLRVFSVFRIPKNSSYMYSFPILTHYRGITMATSYLITI